MEDSASNDSKKKKSRPSRGKGLRTTTGCLTCRKRRLKCDEGQPSCGQCVKSARDCVYGQNVPTSRRAPTPDVVSPTLSNRDSWGTADAVLPRNLQSPVENSVDLSRRYSGLSNNTFAQNFPSASSASTATSPEISRQFSHTQLSQAPFSPTIGDVQGQQPSTVQKPSPAEAAISPATQAASVTPGQAPYEWWDLLAQDAAKSAESYQALKDSNSRWTFEPVDLSRSSAPSPSKFLHNRQISQEQQGQQISRPASARSNGIGSNDDGIAKEPWNTSAPTTMSSKEVQYLQYYVENVGPIFDLFDPDRTFTEYIPHLALRNRGLLKSVLAVSARFKSLHTTTAPSAADEPTESRHRSSFTDDDDAASTQFYFDTLSYLSEAMQYQSYTKSQEILATAALISSYELFHVNRSADWEKHLKGVFWIQRSQETNGERSGLRGAVWWQWLRQDIWAALWQNRKPLTIWEPTKHVKELLANDHEFACRATYMLARAIKYATQDVRDSTDLTQRMQEGERHLQDLDEWYKLLPSSYRPMPHAENADTSSVFPPLWVHPPFHAAALQHYYAAKILIILNRPNTGGMSAYHLGQTIIDESIHVICGLAQSPTALEHPSAMVHFQALYVAGQCVRTVPHQQALYKIFDRILESNKFPSKSILTHIQKGWAKFGHV